MVGEATTSSASDCSAVQHGWFSRRVQQTIEIVEPIYSRNLSICYRLETRGVTIPWIQGTVTPL